MLNMLKKSLQFTVAMCEMQLANPKSCYDHVASYSVLLELIVFY